MELRDDRRIAGDVTTTTRSAISAIKFFTAYFYLSTKTKMYREDYFCTGCS